MVQMDAVDPYMIARVKPRNYTPAESKIEFEAIIGSIRDLAEKIIKLSPNIPSEAVVMIRNIKSDIHLLGFISSNLGIDNVRKQELLEIESLETLATEVFKLMHNEMQMLEIKSQLESKVPRRYRKATTRLFPQSAVENHTGRTRTKSTGIRDP